MYIKIYILFIDLITPMFHKMEIENISEINRIAESLRWKLIGYLEAGKSQYESTKYFDIHQSVPRIWKNFQEYGPKKVKIHSKQRNDKILNEKHSTSIMFIKD